MARFRDINFFHKLHVSSNSFSDHSVSWNFNSVGIAIMIESNTDGEAIEYSFDGTTVHGDCVALTPSEAIIFDNRTQNKIWFRRSSGSSPILVRIEAWGNQA